MMLGLLRTRQTPMRELADADVLEAAAHSPIRPTKSKAQLVLDDL